MILRHHLGHHLGIVHVAVVVAVVAHKADGVLPVAGVVVIAVTDGLVDQNLGISLITDGEAAHSHVGLVAGEHIGTLTVVHQAEVVIGDVAVGLAERVLALVAEQEVVGRIVLPVGGQHTVVPATVAE